MTFSGDKLLGGPQAGIIVGRRDLIEQIKTHPLKCALRVDKLTLVRQRRFYVDILSATSLRMTRPTTDNEAQAQRLAPLIAAQLGSSLEVDVCAALGLTRQWRTTYRRLP